MGKLTNAIDAIYDIQLEEHKKRTIKEDKKQLEDELNYKINYFIDNKINTLLIDFDNNYLQFFNYYLLYKNDLIQEVLEQLKNIKIKKELDKNYFDKDGNLLYTEYKKRTTSKFVNDKNEYYITLLIEELMNKKVDKVIKQHQKEQRIKETLIKQELKEVEETEEPKKQKFEIMGLSVGGFLLANVIALIDVFGKPTKRRRH